MQQIWQVEHCGSGDWKRTSWMGGRFSWLAAAAIRRPPLRGAARTRQRWRRLGPETATTLATGPAAAAAVMWTPNLAASDPAQPDFHCHCPMSAITGMHHITLSTSSLCMVWTAVLDTMLVLHEKGLFHLMVLYYFTCKVSKQYPMWQPPLASIAPQQQSVLPFRQSSRGMNKNLARLWLSTSASAYDELRLLLHLWARRWFR